MADVAAAVTVFSGGIRLTIKAKPGIARKRLPRFVDVGEGRTALEVTVAAIAEDGKANRAILDHLAVLFGVPKNSLTIKTGMAGRLKVVEIVGDPALLRQKVESIFSDS